MLLLSLRLAFPSLVLRLVVFCNALATMAITSARASGIKDSLAAWVLLDAPRPLLTFGLDAVAEPLPEDTSDAITRNTWAATDGCGVRAWSWARLAATDAIKWRRLRCRRSVAGVLLGAAVVDADA
jgi:hypothetical protein